MDPDTVDTALIVDDAGRIGPDVADTADDADIDAAPSTGCGIP